MKLDDLRELSLMLEDLADKTNITLDKERIYDMIAKVNKALVLGASKEVMAQHARTLKKLRESGN